MIRHRLKRLTSLSNLRGPDLAGTCVTDLSDEERAEAEAWEKKVNDYTIANMDRGIEDLFP